MTSALPAWRETYKRILNDNGAITPEIQCMAFAMACQQHSLTLVEFVTERRAQRAPSVDIFTPALLATVSDWDNSWETLGRLLHLETATLERVILHHCATHQPLSEDAYTLFSTSMHKWVHTQHRNAWYQLLTPEQSERVIYDAIASSKNHSSHVDLKYRLAVEHAIANIGPSATTFWQRFVPWMLERFSPMQPDSQSIAKCVLKNIAPNMAQRFVTDFNAKWLSVRRDLNVDDLAQWIADVIELQPKFATIVLDSVVQQHAFALNKPALSKNTKAIDHFLNHGLAKVSNPQQVLAVLDSFIYGQGDQMLRERAWFQKLANRPKGSDIKKMDQWTPAMVHAFNYWLASQFNKHASNASGKCHTYINKDINDQFRLRCGIDLRNPQGFQRWRETCVAAGADPFSVQTANETLYDDWKQGCAMYAAAACQSPGHMQSFELESLLEDVHANNTSIQ